MKKLRDWFPRKIDDRTIGLGGTVVDEAGFDVESKFTSPVVKLEGDVATTESGAVYQLVGVSMHPIRDVWAKSNLEEPGKGFLDALIALNAAKRKAGK